MLTNLTDPEMSRIIHEARVERREYLAAMFARLFRRGARSATAEPCIQRIAAMPK